MTAWLMVMVVISQVLFCKGRLCPGQSLFFMSCHGDLCIRDNLLITARRYMRVARSERRGEKRLWYKTLLCTVTNLQNDDAIPFTGYAGRIRCTMKKL